MVRHRRPRRTKARRRANHLLQQRDATALPATGSTGNPEGSDRQAAAPGVHVEAGSLDSIPRPPILDHDAPLPPGETAEEILSSSGGSDSPAQTSPLAASEQFTAGGLVALCEVALGLSVRALNARYKLSPARLHELAYFVDSERDMLLQLAPLAAPYATQIVAALPKLGAAIFALSFAFIIADRSGKMKAESQGVRAPEPHGSKPLRTGEEFLTPDRTVKGRVAYRDWGPSRSSGLSAGENPAA